MKRVVTILVVLIVVLVVAVAALVGSAFIGRQAITDGYETNGVRIVKDGIVSVGVIPAGSGKVALIDAGNDKAGQAILSELSRRQLGKDAVVAILLTHGHQDHTGAIALFPGAQVMALAPDVGLVEGTEGAHGPLLRVMPVRPTGVTVARPLHDGDSIMVGDTPVRVYAVAGHTQGSAAYLVRGVLFMGDAADASSSGKVQIAPWIFSDSQPQDRESLVALNDRLQRDGTEVKVIVFAHSGVLAEGLAPLAAFADGARK